MSKMTLLHPGMLAEGSRSIADHPIPQVVAPTQTRLPIDPQMVRQLIQEHRQMLDLLQATDAYLARNQQGPARTSLAKLRSLLERHVRVEFEQVYLRLEAAHTASGGRRPAELIRDERTQSRQMFAFFGGHLGADRSLGGAAFTDAFRRFSLELIDHTEREERELFPLLCAPGVSTAV